MSDAQGSGEEPGRQPGELTGRLRDAQPAPDEMRFEQMRARVEQQLFGAAEPACLGRFLLLDEQKAGGMGVVRRAHDPQLDRSVALKVLHPDAAHTPASQERLLAEARALAKLTHPNVVPVHDALIAKGQVVIVMEWVKGTTLADWERAAPRTWREVVRVYLSAGRGLEAAHARGLVHRDFKPANAIIGEDGRVQILDFGLARAVAEQDARELAGAPRPAGETWLTATGEVLGTLGYMSPEQLRGEPASAASDQFSFCVALYRAVCGVAPFSGATREELLASVEAGVLAEPASGRGGPRWLRALLARGLAASPAARLPSMNALLQELARTRGWRRWRLPLVLVAIGAALWAGRASTGGAMAEASCKSGAGELAQHWGLDTRKAVARAMDGAGGALGPGTRDAVLAGLDRYGAAWVEMHRTACLAHRRGAQSAAVLDRRMTCLRRRTDALSAAVTALTQLDTDSSSRARELVGRLPPVADCGDLELLAAEVEPPPTAEERIRLSELEARLAQAVAKEHLGKADEALALLDALARDAHALGAPALLADLELAQGRVLLSSEQYARALAPLRAAEERTFASGLLPRAVQAAARRIYVEAMMSKGDRPGLLRQAEVLELMSRPLRDGFARPLLLNNLGVLHMTMQRHAEARALFVKARAALGDRTPDIELTAITRNIAMVTTDDEERERLAREVWQQRQQLLGDEHLWTLEALLSLGKYVREPGRALPLVARACELYRRHHPDLHKPRAVCGAYQGLLSSELGDPSGAAAAYDEVVALTDAQPGDDLRMRNRLARGAASLERGAPAAARQAFEAVLASITDDGWWSRVYAATAHLGIALAYRAEPRAPRAVMEHLEHAIAVFEEATAINEEVEYKLRLGQARRARAALRERAGLAPVTDGRRDGPGR